MTTQLQNLWRSGRPDDLKLFYVDHKRNLNLNPLAYLKARSLEAFYADLANHYKDEVYFSNMVRQWLDLAPTAILPTTSKWDFADWNGLIHFFLNQSIAKSDHEDFYQVFQVFYKRQCAEVFRADPEKLNQALSIRKGRTQRKSTMNKCLAMLGLPYIVKKTQNCWRLYQK